MRSKSVTRWPFVARPFWSAWKSDPVAVSKFSRIRKARRLDGYAMRTPQKLPPGIHLTEGELHVSFGSPTELAAKLSAAAAAITADWDAFAAETGIASPPDGLAQRGVGDSRPADRLATPAVDRPTPAPVAEEDSSRRVSLKQRYDEFCLAKVEQHLRSLPQAV